jgi:hypothetical protein
MVLRSPKAEAYIDGEAGKPLSNGQLAKLGPLYLHSLDSGRKNTMVHSPREGSPSMIYPHSSRFDPVALWLPADEELAKFHESTDAPIG